ncbi:hypothetical protein SRO_2298 [Streptomyces rochei]|nr:hypothetical protein SRO_2298 [Streptomyces rochei]
MPAATGLRTLHPGGFRVAFPGRFRAPERTGPGGARPDGDPRAGPDGLSGIRPSWWDAECPP